MLTVKHSTIPKNLLYYQFILYLEFVFVKNDIDDNNDLYQ